MTPVKTRNRIKLNEILKLVDKGWFFINYLTQLGEGESWPWPYAIVTIFYPVLYVYLEVTVYLCGKFLAY